MAGKSLDIYRDYIVKEHRTGRSACNIAREFGVASKVIVRILGPDFLSVRALANSVPRDEAVSLYVGGMSENLVAKRYGVSRHVVRRILRLAGVTVRDQSAAETLKWSKMSAAKRKAQTDAAHEACRGRKRTFDELCRQAAAREKLGLAGASEYERTLLPMLRTRGLTVKPQLAIGPYNCDLAVAPVAVEVWGGGWHFGGRHLTRTPERFRYLMNHGWNILVLVISKDRFPLTPAVADHAVAHVKRLRADPPSLCEYRVVWGAGEFTTGGKADDDEITVEPPFTRRRDPATGQYERVAR